MANLNLIAGQKAKAATAYEAAVNYLNVGMELLSQDSWESRYDLTFNFYLEAAEAEYLNANLERAEILCDRALQKAKTILEQVNLYVLKIRIYLAKNQINHGLDTGLQVLKMLGVTLSESPPQELNIEELANLPEMSDRYKLAAMQLLASYIRTCLFCRKHAIATNSIYYDGTFSVSTEIQPQSIYAYSVYGGFVSWLIPRHRFWLSTGSTGFALLDKLECQRVSL